VVYFSDRASIFLASPTHANNERSNTQRGRSPRSFEGPRFLAELRTFLAFLTGLWRMLTGLSLLFALANVFVDVIPVTEHFQPLYRLPPTVVTPLASVTALFVLLATYARRGALPRRAVVIVHGDLRRSPSQPDSPHSPSISSAPCRSGRTCMATPGTPRSGATASSLPATSPSPACTAGSSRFTRTFLLLTMLEYFQQPDQRPP
jgi:hypothetical protein